VGDPQPTFVSKLS